MFDIELFVSEVHSYIIADDVVVEVSLKNCDMYTIYFTVCGREYGYKMRKEITQSDANYMLYENWRRAILGEELINEL